MPPQNSIQRIKNRLLAIIHIRSKEINISGEAKNEKKKQEKHVSENNHRNHSSSTGHDALGGAGFPESKPGVWRGENDGCRYNRKICGIVRRWKFHRIFRTDMDR